ncbi:MAG: DUF3466 family protein [Phycisphaerales bacterium]|nr:MAG: DUF3466 family protein [Phycisphaerales bacterium]
MNHRSDAILGFAAAVLMALAPPAPAAWVVTEVPNLLTWIGGTEPSDINSNGEVCGNGNYVVNNSITPFRYDGTTVKELPFLPDADVPIAMTTAINVHGVICGYSHNAAGDSRACYWEDTTIHAIPYPPGASTSADLRAYDINDHGVIVGYFWKPGSVRTAFYYRDGVSYSLDHIISTNGLTGGLQLASGINNNNVICGIADDVAGIANAYTYNIDTGVFTLIGKIGLADCSAVEINESGQTIGRGKYYPWDTIHRAVTYDGAWHFVDETATSSQWGKDINDNGRMIGHLYLGSSQYASWYSDGPGNGSMVNLNVPGWTSVQVQGINNDGCIVGYGPTLTSGGDARAFVLAPPPGDTDHDGTIDLSYAEFAACISGPAEGAGFVPPSDVCLEAFDSWPRDGDVDLKDFAAFQIGFGGS